MLGEQRAGGQGLGPCTLGVIGWMDRHKLRACLWSGSPGRTRPAHSQQSVLSSIRPARSQQSLLSSIRPAHSQQSLLNSIRLAHSQGTL